MIAEKLDELKSLLAKTTPGKWYYDGCSIAAQNSVELTYADMHGEVYFTNENDAEFIVLARELLPELIAEYGRLHSQLTECETLLSEAHDLMDDVHCYDTEVYEEISKYFYGEEEDE